MRNMGYLRQSLKHHVNHGSLLVLLPGICLLGHLLRLSLGFTLNGVGFCFTLQSNCFSLSLGFNDKSIPSKR